MTTGLRNNREKLKACFQKVPPYMGSLRNNREKLKDLIGTVLVLGGVA